MHTTETKIYIAIIIAACILFIFIAFFIAGVIRYHRISLVKQKEKINADMLLLEQERTRLAADLHDEFGMLVSAIKLRLHCLDMDRTENRGHIKIAEEYIDQLMRRIREVSADLMPPQLQEKGLANAIRHLVADITAAGEINITFQDNMPPVIIDKKLHIYRIVQEITSNALKHAQASGMEMHFTGNNKKIEITISDNGKGFDSRNKDVLQRGLGLANITRRINLLGGKLYLDTAPGKGTRYFIEIPNL